MEKLHAGETFAKFACLISENQHPMRTIFFSILTTIAAVTASGVPGNTDSPRKWVLEWKDDFDGPDVDYSVWSRIDRGTPDWKNTQSHDDRCYEMRNGNVVLKGIVNDNLEADTAHYLTGGLYTLRKKAFDPGKFEVRAKLQGAKGAWPAIWLLPFDETRWPNGGEIDIMERLNHDSIAYQTVHSHYTYDLNRHNPAPSKTGRINPEDYNVYAVEMYPDSIVMLINGHVTNVYPRIPEAEGEGQYPFMRQQYILIDMQLGGRWVGKVDPAELPVEMEVDWVKYYRLEE